MIVDTQDNQIWRGTGPAPAKTATHSHRFPFTQGEFSSDAEPGLWSRSQGVGVGEISNYGVGISKKIGVGVGISEKLGVGVEVGVGIFQILVVAVRVRDWS